MLHLCNTLLVYFFVKRLLALQTNGEHSSTLVPVIVATLFGIHTLQVESVAWISERKTVLYALFFIVSLIQYVKYINNKSLKTYLLSILFFILSLLAKGMAVPLSLCLICIDYYAGRNLLSKKVIWEKIPYLVISLAFGITAILAQHSLGAIQQETNYSLLSHLAVACYGFVQYFIKLCFPFHLSAFYPYPVKPGMLFPIPFYACIVLIILIIFIFWKYFRQQKAVIFGILFFLANLSIVIQLLPIGDAIMADRYVYMASIGFFFLVVYFSSKLWQRNTAYRIGVIIVLALFCLQLSVKTYQRVSVWKDSYTLWNDVLKNYPENNARGYLNRGAIYFEMGKYAEASEDFKHLLSLDPFNSIARKAMGIIKLEAGIAKYTIQDFQGALIDYDESLSFCKSYNGFYNRGVLKMNIRDFEGALCDFDSASGMDTLVPDAYINKGFIFYQAGNLANALQNYNRALQIAPNDSRAFIGRGLTNIKQGNKSVGCEDLRQAATLGNTDAQIQIQKYCN
jgi:tetratricopeptide (TPR) repeat protein